MKKYLNKVTLTILVVLVVVGIVLGVSLSGKNSNTVDTSNKNVPYGSLSDEVIYASVGEIKLSEKALYNELRVNAYDYLFEEILKRIVTPEELNLTVENSREKLEDLILESCFGTSEDKDLAKLNTTSKETAIDKFIDQMYLVNVDDIVDNGVATDLFTPKCLKYFLNQLTQKEYAIREFKNTESKYYWNNEKYLDEDGNKVANPYYIDEDTLESAYNSKFNETATYNVVIVGYDTKFEADAALNGRTTLTYNEIKALYEAKYSYKTPNYFLTTEELNNQNSTLSSLVQKMEKGDCLVNQQIGNKIYHIYLNEEIAEPDYSTITEEQKTELVNEILEDKATQTIVSRILVEKIYDTKVVIYDGVLDALYAAENDKHTRLEASEWKDEYNSKVVTIYTEDKTIDITVEEFYNALEELLGLTTALDYFTSQVLLTSEYADKLTDEDLEKIETEFNDTIAAFENGDYASYGYPVEIGLDTFKFIYYGQTEDDKIIEYYKSQKIWEYYVEDKPANYENLVYEFGKQYHENYYDLSVKHVLLYVDYDNDGTADDPEIFANKLDKEGYNKADFEKEIVRTMTAITTEVNYLVDNDKASLSVALDYVLKAFYANDELLSAPGTNWSQYKNYGIGLKIEDLGSVNNSNASQYVKEFGIGVQDLYNYMNSDASTVTLEDDYLDTRFTTYTTDAEKIAGLIKTSYGYHILGVYDSTEITSAKFTEEDDDDSLYVDIEISEDEDLVENAYSNEEWASANQIKIYVAQINTEKGVTDLPSSVKTHIAKYYSAITTRYENDTFRNLLLALTELNIEFNDTANDAKYAEFIEIQKRQFDAYSNDYLANSNHFLANWWELVVAKTAE